MLSESTYRRMVEHASDAVMVADTEGVIRLWNARAEGIFGYSAEEAIGQTLDLIVSERQRERHWHSGRTYLEEATNWLETCELAPRQPLTHLLEPFSRLYRIEAFSAAQAHLRRHAQYSRVLPSP